MSACPMFMLVLGLGCAAMLLSSWSLAFLLSLTVDTWHSVAAGGASTADKPNPPKAAGGAKSAPGPPSNGSSIPTQTWPTMGYQIPGTMIPVAGQADLQKLMQVDPVV
ncbi:hypothetical protein V6N13_013151 [Hibiscus sabdariffa]|uniref:Uncharacterized protein n=1 Tax=Hibiscus sabdariffa TaxID=183260 RepID=A0ABR2SH74_9ROSI